MVFVEARPGCITMVGWLGGGWLAGWLVGWLFLNAFKFDWLARWLVGWLVGWLFLNAFKFGWVGGGWLAGWLGWEAAQDGGQLKKGLKMHSRRRCAGLVFGRGKAAPKLKKPPPLCT